MKLRLLVSSLFLVAGLVSVSRAVPDAAGEVDYYSDGTLSNWVGNWTKDCYGRNFYVGIHNTQYSVFAADITCVAPPNVCRAGWNYTSLYNAKNVRVAGPMCISSSTCNPPYPGYYCR